MDLITVEEHEENTRIDKLLSDRFQLHSRTYFQYLIEKRSVLINGKQIKKSYLVKPKDEIEIFFIASEEISLEPEDIPINILYEDDKIIVINKPQGMVVHPAPGNWKSTFVNALLHHCKNLPNLDNEPLRPGIVHRLDKDTSGVLIAAKTLQSHQKLISQFSNREVDKTYIAICYGKVENGIYSFPIARNKKNRKEMTVSDTGKEAITEINTLAVSNEYSLIHAKLHTGRTHQIRVHLKHLNAPIIGDPVYGNQKINKKFNIYQQCLHSWRLKLKHPHLNQEMKWQAPFPENMKKLISQLFDFQKNTP